MRKLILLLGVLLAFAAFVSSSASADQSFSNTCGSNGNPLNPPHTPGIDTDLPITLKYLGNEPDGNGDWEAKFTSNCGFGGTFAYEIQHLVGSWGDVHESNGGDIDHQLTSPGVGDHTWTKDPISLNACVHNDQYRLKFYYVDQNFNVVFLQTGGAVYC